MTRTDVVVVAECDAQAASLIAVLAERRRLARAAVHQTTLIVKVLIACAELFPDHRKVTGQFGIEHCRPVPGAYNRTAPHARTRWNFLAGLDRNDPHRPRQAS